MVSSTAIYHLSINIYKLIYQGFRFKKNKLLISVSRSRRLTAGKSSYEIIYTRVPTLKPSVNQLS